jgi:DNA mismatch endonuclease (patch repair protein)
VPSSRPEYWQQKLHGNVARDQKARQELRAQGWRVLTVWECELPDEELVKRRSRRILNGPSRPSSQLAVRQPSS